MGNIIGRIAVKVGVGKLLVFNVGGIAIAVENAQYMSELLSVFLLVVFTISYVLMWAAIMSLAK